MNGAAPNGAAEGGSLLQRPGFCLLLALGLVATAYSAAPLGDFVWDDRLLILENPTVQALQPLHSYFDSLFFGGPAGAPARSFYRPLVVLSFALDWQLWGGNPMGFHLSNLLLHLGCVALLFGLGRRLGASPAVAALAAALFGTLPRLSEAVAWISGRTDLLATLFVLGALLVHRPTWPRRWLAAALLLAGLLSKEVALAGALVLLLREWAAAREAGGGRAGGPRWLLHAAPFGASLLVYFLLRSWAFHSAQATSRAPELALGRRLLLVLETAGTYLQMALVPWLPRTQLGSVFASDPWMLGLGILTLPALGVALFLAWRRRLLGPTGWGLVLLAAVPLLLVSHLFPLALQVVAADRFLYLPAAAACLGLAALAPRLSERHLRAGSLAALPLLASFTLVTHGRSLDWADELSLWSEAVGHAPAGNSLPHLQLAQALIRAGQGEAALAHIDRAAAVEASIGQADGPGPLEARALALLEMGAFEDAVRAYERVARMLPEDPVHRFNLAVALTMGLRFGQAAEELEALLDRYPGYEAARIYREEVRRFAAAFAALPPEQAREAPELALRRAALYRELGRARDARRIWEGLAERPDTPPAIREEARRLAEGP